MTGLVPGATLGIVGGGQLGRMIGEAASPLGVDLIVLDPTPQCPAYPPATDQIVADFDDNSAIRELAERVDAITLEIELADPAGLEAAVDATGIPVGPAPSDLRMTRDKLREKEALSAAGIPVPAYRAVDDRTTLEAAFEDLGSPLMLKARHGGYDGRGNAVVASVAEAESYFGDLTDLVAEELVDFEREVSVMVAQNESEQAIYPLAENVHESEILRETLVPARTSEDVAQRATDVARDVLSVLSGRGVFGIEMFETADGQIYVNELAPRPHNSGHYTIEGAETSQFEQHVRAVLDLPLGSTDLVESTAMANILGDGDESRPAYLAGVESVLSTPGVHLHWYGKREVRPLRKMGHLTATGADLDEAHSLVTGARDTLTFE